MIRREAIFLSTVLARYRRALGRARDLATKPDEEKTARFPLVVREVEEAYWLMPPRIFEYFETANNGANETTKEAREFFAYMDGVAAEEAVTRSIGKRTSARDEFDRHSREEHTNERVQ